MEIKAADVAKLRTSTGAGMMDCKKALVEANGNFDEAVKIIRERGKAIANKRADRDATEGAVLAKASADNKKGALVVVNCETDFVAKNADFVKMTESFLDKAIETMSNDIESLKTVKIGDLTIQDKVTEATAVIGEKIDLSYYDKVESELVVAYIHPGNKVSTLVGLNKKIADIQVAKDVAMQIAAMNPVAIDKDAVPQNIIERELEIGREQARLEGKPEEMLDKIAQGKLAKFFKESTLLEQQFVKDNKITVRQYLQSIDKDLTVTAFVRYSLND
jgi:elongation factor Ts